MEIGSNFFNGINQAQETKGGIEKMALHMLADRHDNWVRQSGNEFSLNKDIAKRFVDLRMMSFENATTGLVEVEKVLKGAGSQINSGILRREFNKQQYEYMQSHGITSYSDVDGIRNYIENLGVNYLPAREAGITEDMTLEMITKMTAMVHSEIAGDKISSRDIKDIATERGREGTYINALEVSTAGDKEKGFGEIAK